MIIQLIELHVDFDQVDENLIQPVMGNKMNERSFDNKKKRLNKFNSILIKYLLSRIKFCSYWMKFMR